MKKQCVRAPKDIKQILTEKKGKIDSNKIIVEDFNTPLPTMDRSISSTVLRRVNG